jgi:hypothetical protein
MKKKKSKSKDALVPLGKKYFTEDTEAAIVQFNQTTDMDEREKIYRTYIERPLDKLAENVINRFKFPYVNHTFDDTKRQVVSFLVINLHKFRGEKGRAFAYFSIVAKNYLILHNTNGWKEEKRSVTLSDEIHDEWVEIDEVIQLESPDEHQHEDIKEYVELIVKFWDANLARIFKKKRDIQIAGAVVDLIRRADSIECFNKKYLYMLIREATDCKTSYITKVVNKMAVYHQKQLQEYFSRGTIDAENTQFFKYE